jgi:hypothetical protein
LINIQFKHLTTTVTSGSGQINVQMTLIPFVGTCKNCAIRQLAERLLTLLPDRYR